MGEGMSELFQGRAVIVQGFCERVGSYSLNPEQGLALMTALGMTNIYSLRGMLYRLRGAVQVKVKIPVPAIERRLKPPPPEVPGKGRAEAPGYVRRVGDQGLAENGFCPRCPKLFGAVQQTALTRDGEDFVYCLACGWEDGWTADGLALTATA